MTEASFTVADLSLRVPGDANGDGVFDGRDLDQVLRGGSYLTGQAAGFSDGDWNGDGVFDQLDILTALTHADTNRAPRIQE
jgi:hypothetical protein